MREAYPSAWHDSELISSSLPRSPSIKSYQAVGVWRWELGNASDSPKPEARDGASSEGEEDEDEDEDEDDVCGICQAPYDGTCPDCKVPGDDCPLSASAGC